LPFYTSVIAVCITVGSLVAPLLRPPACIARRIESVIKSGFIRSPVRHFISAALRRFNRRRLTHATDFTPGSRIRRQRRGKCHAAKFYFNRSLPGVLAVSSTADSGDVDG